MAGQHEPGRELEPLMRQLLRTSSAGSPSACPDAELLAAWADGTLRADEVHAFEEHAADCARCRAMMAAFIRADSATAAPGTPATPELSPAAEADGLDAAAVPFWKRWGLNWIVPIAATATAIAVYIAAPSPEPPRPTSTVATAADAGNSSSDRAPSSSSVGVGAEVGGGAGAEVGIVAMPQVAASSPAPEVAQPERPAPQAFEKLAAPMTAPQSARRAAEPESQRADALAAAPAATPPAEAKVDAAEQANARLASPAPQAPVPAVPAVPAAPRASGGFAPTVETQARTAAAAAAAPAGDAASAAGQADASRLNETVGRAERLRDVALRGLPVAGAPAGQSWRVNGAAVEHSTPDGAWTAMVLPPGVDPARLTAGGAGGGSTWLVGRGGLVILSVDGGSFTRAVAPGAGDVSTIQVRDARSATVSLSDGRRFSTVDGGQRWQAQP